MQRIKRTGLAICLSLLILGGYKESAAAHPAVYPTTSYLLEPAKTVQHHNLFEEVVEPLYQGQFISAGENRIFTIEINNTSFNSFDEFEFLVESIWPVQLLNQEGFALMDTDGDGLLESGPVAPQALLLLNAVVSAPAVANVGEYNEAAVTVYSSNLGIVVGKYILQNTIPAPFVQMYADYGLDNVFLNFISPEKQTLETTGQADIYGFSPTLAGKDHFFVAWRKISLCKHSMEFGY